MVRASATMEEEPDGLMPALVVGLVEKAVNQVLAQDREALAELRHFTGSVIRIKTYQPYAVVYCQLCDEGISLSTLYDGEVDVRIQVPAGKLLMILLHDECGFNPLDFEVKIFGDRALIDSILAIIHKYKIWVMVVQLLQDWVPGIQKMSDVWEKFKLQTPQWVESFQGLPVTTGDILSEVRYLCENQKQLLEEVKAIRLQQEKHSSGHWRLWFFLTLWMVMICYGVVNLSPLVSGSG